MINSPKISKWISQTSEGVVVRFQIQPKAARSEISGEYGDRLKIRVAAPPVDGAANEELLRFLKKLTGISISRIHIIRGETAKSKDVLFQEASLEDIVDKLV
jgi:uncharacterized protein (TIGR00251 family)